MQTVLPMIKTNLNLILVTLILAISNPLNAQTQKGQDIDGEAPSDRCYSVCMPNKNVLAISSIYNDGAGSGAGHARIFDWNGSSWIQRGADIDGDTAGQGLGKSISMPDSNTLAVGIPSDDNNGNNAGLTRVYKWNGANWIQKGSDIYGENSGDLSGNTVVMPDSNTLGIGTIQSVGVNLTPGHTRIYKWNGIDWIQKGSNIYGEGFEDRSSYALSMPDSNTIAIGAPYNDDNGSNSGHVRVYRWNGLAWTQKGIDIDGENSDDLSGIAVSMPDSNTLAIGAPGNDDNGSLTGHVRIYKWSGTAWIQKGADVDGNNILERSGWSVSMPDSNTVAIGAPLGYTGGLGSGTVRIFSWDNNNWVQRGLNISGEATSDNAGGAIDMPDSNTIIIGAEFNDGNGNASGHGRVFIFCTPDSSVDVQTACNSYTWINGVTYFYSNNSDTYTLTNIEGCDSVITLDLTINHPNTGYDVVSACDSYTWINGTTYTATNNSATHTLTNVAGCDSVVTLNLTIINSSTATDIHTACDSYTWIDGNTYTSSNNTATFTLPNIIGCDSIVTLDLTINNSTSFTDVQTACNFYTWIDGNTYTFSNNAATITLTNAAGCDSMITLDLTIDSVSRTMITVNQNTITASSVNGTYQWLDCTNNNAPITNETSSSFTATASGSYAVEISENGCVDTSSCVDVTVVGLNDLSVNDLFTLYPNPTHELFTIQFDAIQTAVEVTVSNVTGQLIHQQEFHNQSILELAIQQPAGIYFVTVQTPEESQTVRLVIQ